MSQLHRSLPGLLLVASLSFTAFVAHGQTPPPIKMGLWEGSTTITMQGMQIPPDVAARLQAMGRPVPGAPHTVVSQSCLTPDEWRKSFADVNRHGTMECTTSNMVQDEHQLSFDESCTSPRGGTLEGHIKLTFDDSEHTRGEMHMKGTVPTGASGAQPLTSDMTISSHFLSADCGDIKPGSPKILKDQ